MANTVLKSANSRVYLIEGRAGPANAPSYKSSFRMTSVKQGFGDINLVEAPDPYNYGKFVQVAQIRAAATRVTTTLEGRYYMDLLSAMIRLSRQGCSFDVQLHTGSCTNPADFNTFTKAIVLEEAYITNYSTDDLGTLGSDGNAAINETVDISASRFYEIRPLNFTTKADAAITNEVLDIIVFDSLGCSGDECGSASDGCSTVFALTKAAGGSPSTPADVVMIQGNTVVARDINTLGAIIDPNAIAGVGSYVVVTSLTDGAYHYALKSQFTTAGVPVFTKVSMPGGGSPYDIVSVGNVAYITGAFGRIWKMTSPTATVTKILDSSLTLADLTAASALDADNCLVVGKVGTILITNDGTNFSLVTGPTTADINCCYMQSKKTWFIGTATGFMYFTTDGGVTWTTGSFSGSGSGVVRDINFSTGAVGYLAHSTAGNVGRIFRTYDGGYTWNLLPETTAAFPTNQRINKLATCPYDANIIWGGGLGIATDGVVVFGNAS